MPFQMSQGWAYLAQWWRRNCSLSEISLENSRILTSTLNKDCCLLPHLLSKWLDAVERGWSWLNDGVGLTSCKAVVQNWHQFFQDGTFWELILGSCLTSDEFQLTTQTDVQIFGAGYTWRKDSRKSRNSQNGRVHTRWQAIKVLYITAVNTGELDGGSANSKTLLRILERLGRVTVGLRLPQTSRFTKLPGSASTLGAKKLVGWWSTTL